MENETKVLVTPKKFYESKTIILNGVVLLISLVSWISESQGAGILPFRVEPELLATVLTALNLVLRLTTSQPIVANSKNVNWNS